VEVITLVQQRRLALFLPLGIDEFDPLGQTRAAVTRHLLQLRQALEFFRPSFAADLLAQLPRDPAQALLLHHHQHRIANVNLIGRPIAHLLLRVFIQHFEQPSRLLSRRFRTTTERRHTQSLARNQHVQEGMALRQRHAARLADGRQFRLLLVIDDDRDVQPLFQRRDFRT
jgi:hypothetical protein